METEPGTPADDNPSQLDQPAKIRLLVSACLLGHKVRYNGGHAHDPYVTDILGSYVDYLPICPESECGLGIPRETLRLVGDWRQPRMAGSRSGEEQTTRMQNWLSGRLANLPGEELDGLICKNRSPSCGMERVKVYPPGGGIPENRGAGLFTNAFRQAWPLLPVEEEGRLHDSQLLENFLERVLVRQRWRLLLAAGRRRGALVAFHTAHKLLILSHSQAIYRQLGKLVADAAVRLDDLFSSYEQLLVSALQLHSTKPKHINVLQHMLGYFKKQLSADEKQEMLEIIDQFKTGRLPLIVPLTMFNHFVRKYGQEYLAGQHYLHPHPLQLTLRNQPL